MATDGGHAPGAIRLGLRANLAQFLLLVLANVGVGGIVGVQRSVTPLVAEQEFHVGSAVAVTSFIVTFGFVKAFANLVSGTLADRWGRRRVLLLGCLLGVPVPLALMWAPSWGWIVAANALLGLNQGLAWSMTVAMKVDLVGKARRGLALGLNEFAGYGAVGASAWLAGWIAGQWGLRPEPFYVGLASALLALTLSALFIRDTSAHARLEAEQGMNAEVAELRGVGPEQNESPTPPRAAISSSGIPPRDSAHSAFNFPRIFSHTSFRDRNLFSACQAGLINNLNDGVVWGILPLLLAQRGLNIPTIGMIAAAYPLAWGLAQVPAGALSDRIGRKGLIVWGMVLQALAHGVIGLGVDRPFASGLTGAIMLGLGTAMVYPTLLAAVGDFSHPAWRARALSVYRFWRDMGYAIGALAAGVIADQLGLAWPVHVAGVVTLASGLAVAALMRRQVH